MLLNVGDRLGPYEILAPLGAGDGRGLSRARHAARARRRHQGAAARVLGRSRAPARFEQEARAAAALNHPNILAVYDIGSSTTVRPYIVSELLEGETLRDAARGADRAAGAQGDRVRACRSRTAWPPRTRRASSIAT